MPGLFKVWKVSPEIHSMIQALESAVMHVERSGSEAAFERLKAARVALYTYCERLEGLEPETEQSIQLRF